MTTDFLEDVGCEIVGPATDLSMAVRLAESEPLDAAVLDINIAGDMIWPVAEELRLGNHPYRPRVSNVRALKGPLGRCRCSRRGSGVSAWQFFREVLLPIASTKSRSFLHAFGAASVSIIVKPNACSRTAP